MDTTFFIQILVAALGGGGLAALFQAYSRRRADNAEGAKGEADAAAGMVGVAAAVAEMVRKELEKEIERRDLRIEELEATVLDLTNQLRDMRTEMEQSRVVERELADLKSQLAFYRDRTRDLEALLAGGERRLTESGPPPGVPERRSKGEYRVEGPEEESS